MLAQRIWSNAVFLVKSYGKLRNYFLKVCWYVFCVSGAVFSKILWKTTKLLFESLLLWFLLFLVNHMENYREGKKRWG